MTRDDLWNLSKEWIYQHNEGQSAKSNKTDEATVASAPYLGFAQRKQGDSSSYDQWRDEYQRTRHDENRRHFENIIDIQTLDPSVIKVIAESCQPIGPWTAIEYADACHFSFKAGYRSDRRTPSPVYPLRLTGSGAKCSKWVKHRNLPPLGDGVQCTRGPGRMPLLTLDTDDVGQIKAVVDKFPVAQLPRKPELVQGWSEPKDDVVRRVRRTWGTPANQFIKVAGDKDCHPDCKDLLAVDFTAPNGGKFVAVSRNRSVNSAHFLPCDGGVLDRCKDGPGERPAAAFTPVNDAAHAGCEGATSCRHYWISGDGNDADVFINIKWVEPTRICTGCADNVTFEQAVADWQKAVKDAQAASTCPALAKEDFVDVISNK